MQIKYTDNILQMSAMQNNLTWAQLVTGEQTQVKSISLYLVRVTFILLNCAIPK